MKVFFILLFCTFYLIVSSGFAIHMHYCGGAIKEISFFQPIDESACCGSDMEEDGCCHDKTTFVKVKEKQLDSQTLQVKFDSKSLSEPALIFPIVSKEIQDFSTQEIPANYHSPPKKTKTPVYLFNRVLII